MQSSQLKLGCPQPELSSRVRNEDMELAKYLDWADETREAAAIRMAAYQPKIVVYYNRKVRPRAFKEGTLVLRNFFENTAERGQKTPSQLGGSLCGVKSQ